ncbi:hypothetical protein ULF88_11030 [Halopseudomonas pachastrellae]|nr:hypothetical protein [Halopseudomonas pachastrellae]
MMESNLRRALSISNGDLSILFSSPITIGLWVLVAAMVALPFWRRYRAKRSVALASA